MSEDEQPKSLSEAGKLLLLCSLLAKQGTISNNAKSFLKEMILRRDGKLAAILAPFEHQTDADVGFLEQLHELIRNESEATYNDLFTDTSLEIGKSLSKSEREQKNLNEDKSLIYGEVEYKSFYAILRKVQPIAGPTFYDLGSGTGKAVFAARLTADYDRCIGIEILQGLHTQAFNITERYNSSFRPLLDASQRQHAAVYMGSFLEFDWTDGDVVFANSTCFDDDLMAQLSRMAEGLKPGAVLVTFTRGLTYMDHFELLQKKREKVRLRLCLCLCLRLCFCVSVFLCFCVSVPQPHTNHQPRHPHLHHRLVPQNRCRGVPQRCSSTAACSTTAHLSAPRTA
jgi:SAM-dependent methyltransferase